MQAILLLKNEHDVIKRALDLLGCAIDHIKNKQPLPIGFETWAIDFFRNFADRCHHSKEEDVLFPLLEVRGITREGGSIGVMLSEHTIGRKCVRNMEQATKSIPHDLDAFAAAAEEYAKLLRQHILKENNVLFPSCLSWNSRHVGFTSLAARPIPTKTG